MVWVVHSSLRALVCIAAKGANDETHNCRIDDLSRPNLSNSGASGKPGAVHPAHPSLGTTPVTDPNSAPASVPWYPALVIGSALFAVVMMWCLVLMQRSELRTLTASLDKTVVQQLHAGTRQRLLGSQINLDSLVGVASDDVRVVWVFDPEACDSCVHEVSRWNRAILKDYPLGLAIMSGSTESEAHEVSERMGIRTAYVGDEESEFRLANGLHFDSSFLILNDVGRVVYAEFHDGHQECARDVLALARDLVGPEFALSRSSAD